jgi:hypothetical protein
MRVTPVGDRGCRLATEASRMRYVLVLMVLLLLIRPAVAAPTASPTVSPNTNEFKHWTGDYRWDEVVPDSPSVMWQYRIHVYEADKTLVADINVDGFQTKMRLQATCQPHGDKLALRFDRYREGLNDGNFKRGQTLLTWHQKGDRLVTDWVELLPQMRDNRHRGEYFEKTQPATPGAP